MNWMAGSWCAVLLGRSMQHFFFSRIFQIISFVMGTCIEYLEGPIFILDRQTMSPTPIKSNIMHLIHRQIPSSETTNLPIDIQPLHRHAAKRKSNSPLAPHNPLQPVNHARSQSARLLSSLTLDVVRRQAAIPSRGEEEKPGTLTMASKPAAVWSFLGPLINGCWRCEPGSTSVTITACWSVDSTCRHCHMLLS